MGIKRRKGSIQKGKKPLLINNLKKIINVIDSHNNKEIKKFRDRSIILIGFSGGFRRNEIVSLDYEDLDFVPEGLKINLRRSKTDQFGEGAVKGLPYFDNSQYCPVVISSKMD
jgi:integrase